MAYSTIDIGPGAANRNTLLSHSYTFIDKANSANATGILDVFEFYFVSGYGGGESVKVGTFSGSGTTWDDRDYESIGNVTAGSKQTFTGKNCDVSSGDLLGIYYSNGYLECSTDTGSRNFFVSGDKFGSGSASYGENFFEVRAISIYATGYTKPDAPTNVAATENDSAKVTITWTKSTGATTYSVSRDATNLGFVGDVATYDDTGADAPVITPGSAVASDGIYSDKVALSLSGTSIANGTTHTYHVYAWNSAGYTEATGTDTGYRKASTISYQWQVSAGDSDASYSDIGGATTASYDYTEAPIDGSGRYYKCVISSSGATQQTSTANRGYRNAAGGGFLAMF
jgi:hypothetical protein